MVALLSLDQSVRVQVLVRQPITKPLKRYAFSGFSFCNDELLFDLGQDRMELKNLTVVPEYAKILERLRDLLVQHLRRQLQNKSIMVS